MDTGKGEMRVPESLRILRYFYVMIKISVVYRFSSKNKKLLTRGEVCSCFCCLRSYDPEEITEWVDEGQTAVCPYCGVDAVLPQSKRYDVLDSNLLKEMNSVWFKK